MHFVYGATFFLNEVSPKRRRASCTDSGMRRIVVSRSGRCDRGSDSGCRWAGVHVHFDRHRCVFKFQRDTIRSILIFPFAWLSYPFGHIGGNLF